MKIAIVKLSALGDIVNAMIVLQYLKRYNQAIEIDWLVEGSYKELLELNPDINKVIVINLKKAKKKKSLYLLFNELRKVRELGPYDLVIDMQGLLKSAVISYLIPSSITLGFEKSSLRESFASVFYNKTFKYGYDKNIIERNCELIKFAFQFSWSNEEIHHKLPFLYSSQKHFGSNISNTKKNIILIPGASHVSKCYPISKYAQLTSMIDANFIIIWGNQNEKLLAYEIKALSSNVNVSSKLSLGALISLINQVDLVIGGDTGPTHMAWALNKPSICLYGPTPGYRNSFTTKVNLIIESESKVNIFNINKKDLSISKIDAKQIAKKSKILL